MLVRRHRKFSCEADETRLATTLSPHCPWEPDNLKTQYKELRYNDWIRKTHCLIYQDMLAVEI